MPSKHDSPILSLTREAWRHFLAMSLGHVREGGGLLIGHRNRLGNYHVEHVIGMTHARASNGYIQYEPDEVARAKRAAYLVYSPLEPIGEWHTHPFKQSCREAFEPLMSDLDFEAMLEEDLELIASIFPDPGYRCRPDSFILQECLGDLVCRAEAWLRRRNRPVRCQMRIC